MTNKTIVVSELKDELTDKTLHKCREGIAKAIEHAKQAHASGLPKLKGDDLSLYILPITSGFEAISAEINSAVNSAEQMMIGSFIKGSFNDQEKTYRETSRQLTERVRNLDKDYNLRKSTSDYWKYIMYTAAIMFIAGGESVISVNAIRDASSNVLTTFLLFASLFVTYLGISKLILKWFSYAQSLATWKKWLGHLGVFTALSTAFYLLGSMRISDLQATAIGAEEVFVSPFTFMCINLLFLAGSVTLHFFREPYKTNAEDEYAKSEYRKEKKNLTKQREANDTEYTEFKKDFPEDQKGRIALLSCINPLHNLIKAKYKEAVSAFISEVVSRSQGQTADCLTQKIPELDLADYFSAEDLDKQSNH